MRKSIKIPRILKVQDVQGMALNLVFNNGESRRVDFDKFLTTLKLNPASPANLLKKPEELRKLTLTHHSLCWENIQLNVKGRDGEKLTVPFEVGADTLYDISKLLQSHPSEGIGSMLKEARKKAGITQDELAIRSGTSKTYISRIENEKSGIELDTLYKIVEIGLGKHLHIKIL